MFNLLMFNADWASGRVSVPIGRLFEYTEQYLIDAFRIEGAPLLDKLAALPCLFCEEGTGDEVAYVGQINRIRLSGSDLALEISFDTDVPQLRNEFLYTQRSQLDMPHDFEFSRNHWAIKEISEVTSINATKLAYERLPARNTLSIGTQAVRLQLERRTVDREASSDRAAKAALNPGPVAIGEQVAQTDAWCRARYRSYDPIDSSYQPYGGGPRRPCAAPREPSDGEGQHVALAEPASGINEGAYWCSERYASYRVEDNSYQPFTGARKQCRPPKIVTASSATRTTDTVSVTSF